MFFKGDPASISTAAPSVYNYIQNLNLNQNEKLNLYLSTLQKVQASYDKLNSDMNDRISEAVLIFKACRLFNYRFIASNPPEAIHAELETLAIIPSLRNKIPELRIELDFYIALAVDELYATDEVVTEHSALCENLWRFWLKNNLTLPRWSSASNIIAIIMTSSGAVERSFSLYLALFGDGRESALQDIRELSTILRYNSNRVKSESDQ